MPRTTLCHFLRLTTLAALMLCAGVMPAAAQDFPSRLIRLVAPFPPGGPADVLGRPLADGLQAQLGQPVIVEFKPGAGAISAVQSLQAAPADGHTIMLGSNVVALAMGLYKKLPYDTLRDLRGVAPVTSSPYMLLVPASYPGKLADLIREAKAAPGKYLIASAGNGTLNHLIGEMLGKATGISLVHVPYKGASAAVTDVVGGQVQLSVQSLPSSISFIKTGKLKVLGVVNARRVAALPDAPTIGETLQGFGEAPWYAMFAPAGTPAPIVAQLQAEVARALEQKDVVDKLAGVGCEPFKGSSAQLGALVQSDLPKWARVVKDTGATVD